MENIRNYTVLGKILAMAILQNYANEAPAGWWPEIKFTHVCSHNFNETKVGNWDT